MVDTCGEAVVAVKLKEKVLGNMTYRFLDWIGALVLGWNYHLW